MKITQPVNTTPPASANTNKGTKARDAARSSDAANNDGDAILGESSAPAGRDFADILDSPNNKSTREEDGNKSEWQNSTSKTEHANGERKTKRGNDDSKDRDAASANASRGFDRLAAREVQSGGEVKSPRAILNIADLERIVSTIRTQFVAGNRREVTIDLHRSVLEGLRVKISSDDTGRVTAEFISASAAIKEQVDAHAAGLADLLRSRGVDLASLKTSVGGDAAGQDDNSRGNNRDASAPVIDHATATQRNDSASAIDAPASTSEGADNIASSTYRA